VWGGLIIRLFVMFYYHISCKLDKQASDFRMISPVLADLLFGAQKDFLECRVGSFGQN